MERKVGEIFEYSGEWYQCIEQPKQHNCDTGCELCSFKVIGNCDLDKCSGTYRSDSKSVIFKKLEKLGEPIWIFGKEVQLVKTTFRCCHNCTFRGENYNCELVVSNNRRSCLGGEEGTYVEIKQNKENMEEKKLNYEELEHYYDSTCGLWAIDRNPKEVTLEWIVENAFQLGDATHEKACVSNLKPFDLEAAKAGKPVCTRDGRKVRIISFDRKFLFKGVSYPIIALVEDAAKEETIYGYNEKGKTLIENDTPYKDDLMMLPQKKEGWVRIYKSASNVYYLSSNIYKTEEEAKHSSDCCYVGASKISWEE